MGTPYLGEVRLISFNYPPKGWAFCNGQTLAINQNQALFALLGTMYGGNGTTTFALPDLQGRTAIHVDADYVQGSRGGQESHTLTTSELPSHRHSLKGLPATGNSAIPAGRALATTTGTFGNVYAPTGPVTSLGGSATASDGGGRPHENMQPYLIINFVIALQGIFPSRN